MDGKYQEILPIFRWYVECRMALTWYPTQYLLSQIFRIFFMFVVDLLAIYQYNTNFFGDMANFSTPYQHISPFLFRHVSPFIFLFNKQTMHLLQVSKNTSPIAQSSPTRIKANRLLQALHLINRCLCSLMFLMWDCI